MNQTSNTQTIERLQPEIEDFCHRWKVAEMALFGSVLTDRFKSDSDIDVLIRFLPDHGWGLYEWIDMREELEAIFGRKVDLVAEDGLRNPYRRKSILESKKIVYETATE